MKEAQITKLRNESGNSTINPTMITRTTIESYQQLSPNKLDNLQEGKNPLKHSNCLS